MSVETTLLQPFDDNPNQAPRWMDIADYLYGSVFKSGFAYPSDTVVLGYTTQESPLRFSVKAPYRSLKPNFCYQMKIEGPPNPWANDPTGSDFVNYQLGSKGRWWCDTCNLPLTDQDVASGAHLGHRVKGYLYFDFVVTDANGSVEQTSAAINSYHVTWKTSQRGPTAQDGSVRTYTVVANRDGWAYDRKHRVVKVGLYGEGEPGRPLPGQMALAAGTYVGVEFRLTEESFHSARPDGGNWRTVMAAPVPTFTISTAPTLVRDVAITELSAPGPPARTGKAKTVRVTVANQGQAVETTDVTLTDDRAATIGPQQVSVTVEPGRSAVAAFTWTPGEPGEHMLVAEAAPVPEETDTGDNTASAAVGVR